jgi:hypothetical protein
MFDVQELKGDFPLTANFLAPVLLDMPQAECSVYHRFGPDIYIRELHMKAGTIAVGHKQRFEHINILLKGKVLMFNPDETTTTLEAPLFFIGKPGQKVGYVLEDVVWQNIYSTKETDIDTLENTFLDKDFEFVNNQLKLDAIQKLNVIEVQADYLDLLDELQVTEEQVQEQVNLDNICDYVLPENIRLAKSNIHGKGIFATASIPKHTNIALAKINDERTLVGRYTNHSNTPNCAMVLLDNGDIELHSITEITGCLGGQLGDELTVNYRDVLTLQSKLIKGN